MEVLIYKIPADTDLHIGLQVAYCDTYVQFTKLGIIVDNSEIQDGVRLYQLSTAVSSLLSANELRLVNQLEQDKVTALSNEFSLILAGWCSKDELAEINRLNATPEYVGECASHNYYDANQAMLDAFENVFKREFIFLDAEIGNPNADQYTDDLYINASWDLSKQNKFAQPAVIGCPFDEPFTYNPSTLIN